MDKEDEATEVLKQDYCQENSYLGIDPIIVRIVKNAALRAIGKAGYREHDRADIEQELMTAAIIGLRDSNCNETPPIPINLVKCIIKRQLCGMMRRRLVPGKDWHRRCISLNEEIVFDDEYSGTVELLEMVDAKQRLRLESPHEKTEEISEYLNLKMDVEQMCARLAFRQRKICETLQHESRRGTAECLDISRDEVEAALKNLSVLLRE